MARREARRHARPTEADAPPEDAADEPAEEVTEAAPPNAPPIRLMLAIVGVGVLVLAAFLWLRGSGVRGSGPAMFDKNREAQTALVGAWRCSKEADGFSYNETLILLDGGRYTRQQHVNKPGESWMNLEERSGSWQVVDEQVLFTIDSCVKYDAKDTKLCLPSHTLTHSLTLPVADEIKIGESCVVLKRLAKRPGS
jgi:hypothetical protein